MAQYCDLDTKKCFKEGNWIPLSEVGKLKEGDLVELPSMFPRKYPLVGGVIFPLVNHYGIYLEIDGKPMIAHNPFAGSPEIITLEKFETDRKIKRIIRTGITSEEIIKKYESCKHIPYQFFGQNCEGFISYICSCKNGYLDQRVGWALFIIMIILLILVFRK